MDVYIIIHRIDPSSIVSTIRMEKLDPDNDITLRDGEYEILGMVIR